MKKTAAYRIIFLGLCLGVFAPSHAEVPYGIIGGQTSTEGAYTALLSGKDGIVPLSGLPTNGTIYDVAINNAGFSLIGGMDGSNGYIASASPDGRVTPLTPPLGSGALYAVAINQSGAGLIGGESGFSGYAALISPSGVISPCSPAALYIADVGLTDSGLGLIGGVSDIFTPYVAYVFPDGTLTSFPPLTSGEGYIAGASLNEQSAGIVGGTVGGFPSGTAAYGALVFPDGTALPLNPLPSGTSATLNAVAINGPGIGLIGGTDGSGNMYAGYVSTDGTVTPLFNDPASGNIVYAVINDTGTGLLGGYTSSVCYAALMQPDRTIMTLDLGVIPGQVQEVALTNEGVGLIAGQVTDGTGYSSYAALVAPNGTVTSFDLNDQGALETAAFNTVVPDSVGPYASAVYAQLATATALENRLLQQNGIWDRARKETQETNEETHVACNDSTPNAQEVVSPSQKSASLRGSSLWLSPFGNDIHLAAQDSILSYRNEIGGALLAYDWRQEKYLIGAGVAYAFDAIRYSQQRGHGKVQEEMAVLYGAQYWEHLWWDAALWGGLVQFWNTRHSFGVITSHAMTQGWIVSPHAGLASPWALDAKQRYWIEPFFTLDWVNYWQTRYTESGASGFNLQMNGLYGSLLQSELGLRFYEQFLCKQGHFRLEEKLSYVNQAPFFPSSVETAFVSAPSGFPVAVGSTKIENLGAAQLTGWFVPCKRSLPYIGLSLQATANGSYQSYFVSLFGGGDF